MVVVNMPGLKTATLTTTCDRDKSDGVHRVLSWTKPCHCKGHDSTPVEKVHRVRSTEAPGSEGDADEQQRLSQRNNGLAERLVTPLSRHNGCPDIVVSDNLSVTIQEKRGFSISHGSFTKR